MFREQIERGMDLLDRRFPGWSMHINIDRLDMAVPSFPGFPLEPTDDICGCVLGQLGVIIPHGNFRKFRDSTNWGSYNYMLDVLFGENSCVIPTTNIAEYGFTVDLIRSSLDSAELWNILTREWKQALLRRRMP